MFSMKTNEAMYIKKFRAKTELVFYYRNAKRACRNNMHFEQIFHRVRFNFLLIVMHMHLSRPAMMSNNKRKLGIIVAKRDNR